MMGPFAERLRSRGENGRRLFWFEGVSGERLERVYGAPNVLSASLGEGVGEPPIEPAHRELPLIARDISVFREVADDKAHDFSGTDLQDHGRTVQVWVDVECNGRAPNLQSIRSFRWSKSACALLDVVLDGAWYAKWCSSNRPIFAPQAAPTIAHVEGSAEPAITRSR